MKGPVVGGGGFWSTAQMIEFPSVKSSKVRSQNKLKCSPEFADPSGFLHRPAFFHHEFAFDLAIVLVVLRLL